MTWQHLWTMAPTLHMFSNSRFFNIFSQGEKCFYSKMDEDEQLCNVMHFHVIMNHGTVSQFRGHCNMLGTSAAAMWFRGHNEWVISNWWKRTSSKYQRLWKNGHCPKMMSQTLSCIRALEVQSLLYSLSKGEIFYIGRIWKGTVLQCYALSCHNESLSQLNSEGISTGWKNVANIRLSDKMHGWK